MGARLGSRFGKCRGDESWPRIRARYVEFCRS
jgi:hypothetical protein